jgi:hypothetical protein
MRTGISYAHKLLIAIVDFNPAPTLQTQPSWPAPAQINHIWSGFDRKKRKNMTSFI